MPTQAALQQLAPQNKANSQSMRAENQEAEKNKQEVKKGISLPCTSFKPFASHLPDSPPEAKNNAVTNFNSIPVFSPSPFQIRAKPIVNQPGDQYEREADAMAESVMQIDKNEIPETRLSPPDIIHRKCATCGNDVEENDESIQRIPIQRKCDKCEEEEKLQRKELGSSAPEVSPAVNQTLQSPGQPLDEDIRSLMEPRFGFDFSKVRIHNNSQAKQSAKEINARAYTYKNNIVFGEGQYQPQTQNGKKLLAHELTHVVQQLGNMSAKSIQRKPGDKTEPKKDTNTTRFKIRIDRKLNADELVYTFVQQYYGYSTDAQIQTKLSLWTNQSKRGTTAAEEKQGFAIANVTSQNQTDFGALELKDQQAINDETDKRFWQNTGYKPGEKLGSSPKDKEMAEVWKGTRNAVLSEDKQKKDIAALPDDIKKVLFAGENDPNASAVSPDDYVQVLRIAQKLAQLSPEARQDYLSRINASTTSYTEVEKAIDNYIKLQEGRKQQLEDNEKAAKPLFLAEDVYESYRFYQLYLKNVPDNGEPIDDNTPAKDDEDFARRMKRNAQTTLLTKLKAKGFDSIESFEASIEAYRVAFRTQAVNLALDVLARYDHMLYEERKKLQNPQASADIVKGIAGSNASQLYQESKDKAGEARKLRHKGMTGDMWNRAKQFDKESEAKHADAENEVIRGSGNDPLVAERGIDREKLTGLDPSGMQAYLLETIEKRSADVVKTRAEFKDDPDRVFKLPDLISASQQIQGIDGGSVYAKIIKDHVSDEHARHIISEIAIGILALALALLVPGGGWLAAAALVANAGLSTYQAYKAYQDYEEQERDYKLHFLKEEPSLIWVGIAIAAAALDIGMAASALIKESSIALKELEVPLKEFSKDNDLAKLVAKIEAADGLKAEVKAAMEREAKASLAAKGSLEDLAAVGSRLNGFLGMPDPGIIKLVFRSLYYSVKRGVNTIAKLRADAKFVEALGDITKMTGAERAELETAFDEVKQLVKAGQAKSMDDASLLGYVDRWSINRSKPGFQAKLLDDMKVWKPLSAEQQRALDVLNAQKSAVTTLYEQKAIAEEELAALRAKPDRSAEDIAEIRSLESELSELDPVAYPPRKPGGIGKIAEAEKTLVDKEKEAVKAQLSLYDRLRAAAPSDAAKERAIKGITTDQIGPLRVPPKGLQADHIVSVREISDMDGFADLPWKDQKAIVDMKENLIAMDASANASKGDRTWRSWSQANMFYEQAAIDTMAKREALVRAAIQAEIEKRLSLLKGLKP
ncbi:MAG: hypothetical protein JWQ57_16 [Mucilaginibacter sp.]|nr:hypothetical protein [Mucilaginibacter sp.]